MGWLDNNKKIKDERLIAMKNKIYREIYILIMFMMFISIGIKYYLYGFNGSVVVTEIGILFLSSVYYLVRMVQLGLYSDEVEVHDRGSKLPIGIKNIIIGIISGVSIAVFFGVRSAVVYGNERNRLWYFILVFFGSLMIYLPFFVSVLAITDGISRKLSKKVHQKDNE